MRLLPIPALGLALAACCIVAPHLARAQGGIVELTTPLRLATPPRAVKGGEAVYIVKLKEPGAAAMRSVSVLDATRAGPRRANGARVAAMAAYARELEVGHDRMLGSIGAATTKLYSFRYALNGFAAKLSAAQASALARRPEVERIWLDSDRQLATNNSAIFLGLENPSGGLRAERKLRGEGIVVGVIDSGVAPGHPSLKDTEERIPRTCRSQWARSSWLGLMLCSRYRRHPPTVSVYDPPAAFRGECATGDGFGPDDCNNKVVGARFYLDGFLARHELDPHEFRSPRDADGHGTHVATTIAGNPVDARLFGTRVARVAGIAPRARVAIYKACWVITGETRATCATSDLARAIDDAVADGVDLINYSLGSLEPNLTGPDDLALLNAFDAGVLSVVAAGNDGPGLDTIGSPSSAPWVLTVAASTQTGTLYDEAVSVTEPKALVGDVSMREASFTPPLAGGDAIEASVVAVDDGQGAANGAAGTRADACQTPVNAADLAGRIALIERGACEFQQKIANVEQAGAIAAVVYDTSDAPIVMNGDAGSVGIPAVMIGAADGRRLADALAAGDDVKMKLAKGIFVSLAENGNQMADFSSRGPALSDRNFLKPDVTAPGVDILAGATPTPANGLEGELFQYFSGTSQAAPEVAGIAALLKEAHPDWSPAALKSALMTSAYQGVIVADGSAANPFDMGAGHIDPNRAVEPRLVYESTIDDHAAYLCSLLDPPYGESECAALAATGLPSRASDVNLPSIAVAELVSGDGVRRRVTNVGAPATFTAEVRAPADVDVIVEPQSLVLDTGQSAEYSLRFVTHGAPFDLWDFGSIGWSDGERSVRSPIALQPVALRVVPELRLSGRSGSATLSAAFGYSGAYAARVHGLRAPFTDPATGQVPRGFVSDDPGNRFSFPLGSGVGLHGIQVPADQLFLRVALFDELTDGNDDLDLYLFFCPDGTTSHCTQVAESGELTSNERIDITMPEPGLYVAAVHGFETDEVAGGPGANYSLFAWSFGVADAVGNLAVTAPDTVAEGERLELPVSFGSLAPGTRYLGAISHDTPFGLYALTIVDVAAP